MSHTARKVTRLRFNDMPSDTQPVRPNAPCGCPMCRLKRAQAQRENHDLSHGVYEQQYQSQRVSDRSPRASLLRLVQSGDITAQEAFAEINRRNTEFWKKRGGLPDEPITTGSE